MEKISLLITFQYFYLKMDSLPAGKRKSFETPVEEYEKLLVKQFKTMETKYYK